MNKIGILHLSDIHVSEKSIPDIDVLIKKLIKDIELVKEEQAMNIDMVCFAGDLIERGDYAFENESQIKLAEDHFINPLLDALGLPDDRFILVPGNHEVDRRKIATATERGLAAISSPEEIEETIFNMEEEYKSRLSYFYEYMYEKYIPDANKWNLGYSVKRTINNVKIGIAGIDSAWRSTGIGNSERGKMFVGKQQILTHLRNIEDCDLKICIMHHPLDWLSNLEMSNVERELNGFDFVLRGHVHDLDDKQICRQNYRTIYNTSGKLYPIDDFYSGYSLIDVDMDMRKCYIYAREYYHDRRNEFDKALRISKEGKAEYLLQEYDETKHIEIDLKLQLKKYYEDATEKYNMLKRIDNFSPSKEGDFFVEPSIYDKSIYEREKAIKNGEGAADPVTLEDLIETAENIVIFGKRDGGKTTVLQQIGLRSIKRGSNYIPIYIDLKSISKGKDKIFNECRNFIFKELSEEVSLNNKQVMDFLTAGKILCLVDNVDFSNADHLSSLYSFAKKYPNNRFVFASEERFYQTYSIKDLPDLEIKYKSMYLDSFKKRQVREMITKWGVGKEGFDANEMTKKIVAYCNNVNFSMTPFNIAVFMTIWDVDRNFIPINEGKVMRTYLETILDKLSAEGFQRSEYDFDVKQHFLGYIASRMYENDKYYFEAEEFEKIVNEYHDALGFQKSKSKFDKIFFEKNILSASGSKVFFSNTGIMEYCFAYFATIDTKLYERMISRGNRRMFTRELAFYSGIVNDCTDLLDIINIEILQTLVDNMEVLDEIEKIKIGSSMNIQREIFSRRVMENRKSMEEIDEMEEKLTKRKEKTPMEITKIETIDESESFLDLLIIYGNAIKNAETMKKNQKQIHLDTYILGMNFVLGMIKRELSRYIESRTIENLPKELRERIPDLTEKEFEEYKKSAMDLVTIFLPVGFQLLIAENVGSPKLNIIVKELIYNKEKEKFTRFMLTFLYCDMGNGDIKRFLSDYINIEESKDIMELVLMKLGYYYSMRYFGIDSKMDDMLIELMADVKIKLTNKEKLKSKVYKGTIKRELKQQADSMRCRSE